MAVEWWRGVHQTQTLKLLGGVRWDAAPVYLPTLLLSVASFTVLYFFLLRLRGTLAAREEAREERELTGVTGLEVARG